MEFKTDLVGDPKGAAQHVEEPQELISHVLGMAEAVEQDVGVRHEQGGIPYGRKLLGRPPIPSQEPISHRSANPAKPAFGCRDARPPP